MRAQHEIGAKVVLAEVYRGSPTYTSRIFVSKDSGIRTLADLRGKTIAFADPISESGYLYPLDLFAEAGAVGSVHIPTDRETGRPRGFGFVEMEDPGAIEQAIQMFNGYSVDGRALVVNQARPRESRPSY